MAFDGANVWVSTSGNYVAKLRTSDGAILGNFSAGNGTENVAFDGANIWVAKVINNTVSKL